MSYSKPSQHLKHTSPAEEKRTITSDQAWAFTEQPKTDLVNHTDSRIEAHDLFDLFTASIIKAKTNFIR